VFRSVFHKGIFEKKKGGRHPKGALSRILGTGKKLLDIHQQRGEFRITVLPGKLRVINCCLLCNRGTLSRIQPPPKKTASWGKKGLCGLK